MSAYQLILLLLLPLTVSIGIDNGVASESGIGGTGQIEASDGSGLGGTGLQFEGDGSGIGGTGKAPVGDGDGIGGTGAIAETDGSGIGGTGIVGTITAFGSIWVNGLEVFYPDDQTVTMFDSKRPTVDLRIGQVVAVEADTVNGQLVARDISVNHELAGPVQHINHASGEMTVLGQQVKIPDGKGIGQSLDVGDWVAVSGMRNQEGHVEASRLDYPPKGVGPFIRGSVERMDADGIVINGQHFAVPPDVKREALQPGREVVLHGDLDGNTLRGRRLHVESAVPFNGRVKNLVMEGIVGPNGRQVGRMKLPGQMQQQRPGERVILQGRMGKRTNQLELKGMQIKPAKKLHQKQRNDRPESQQQQRSTSSTVTPRQGDKRSPKNNRSTIQQQRSVSGQPLRRRKPNNGPSQQRRSSPQRERRPRR